MKNTKRKVLSLVLSLFMMTTSFSLAHGGRTDANGGHKDNKNVSGLGSYHYHCGGNPAHLHTGGVCPYKTPPAATATTATAPSAVKCNVGTVNPNAVRIAMPNYTIKLNTKAIVNLSAKYPLFNYNNIVYLPLTTEHGKYLGFNTEWNDSTGLNIIPTSTFDNGAISLTSNAAPYTVNGIYSATKINYNVSVNAVTLIQDANYPFLSFNGITYIPLTSDNATKLGLQVSWDAQTGFSVSKIIK